MGRLYFAYGSNLHPAYFKRRAPSSSVLFVSVLTGRKLLFHKRGKDGSGKCNALAIGEGNDRVYGVVYALSSEDEVSLDKTESLGCGYNKESVTVTVDGRDQTAFTYIADPSYIDDTLKPYAWYKALVVGGAEFHGFPADYVATIRQVQAGEDPDEARRQRFERILSRLH